MGLPAIETLNFTLKFDPAMFDEPGANFTYRAGDCTVNVQILSGGEVEIERKSDRATCCLGPVPVLEICRYWNPMSDADARGVMEVLANKYRDYRATVEGPPMKNVLPKMIGVH